jgi:hypothetical protein
MLFHACNIHLNFVCQAQTCVCILVYVFRYVCMYVGMYVFNVCACVCYVSYDQAVIRGYKNSSKH